MKNLFFLLMINVVFAQDKVMNNYEICNGEFLLRLNRNFEKKIAEKFIFRRDSSYAYYIDANTMSDVKVKWGDPQSLPCVPYQYFLNYELVNEKKTIIKSFRISFLYINGRLQMEKTEKFKTIFDPYILVIENKVISVEEALLIAKEKGINATVFELDYEKNEETNEYKKNKRRVVWILKELTKNEAGYQYCKVIQINAKNGKVRKRYDEFFL